MPRARYPRGGRKPSYKWCGHNQVFNVNATTGLAFGDAISICPSLGDAQIPGDVIIERIFLSFTTKRILTTELDAYGMLVSVD